MPWLCCVCVMPWLCCVCVMPWLSCVCVMPWLSCVCVMPWVVSVSCPDWVVSVWCPDWVVSVSCPDWVVSVWCPDWVVSVWCPDWVVSVSCPDWVVSVSCPDWVVSVSCPDWVVSVSCPDWVVSVSCPDWVVSVSCPDWVVSVWCPDWVVSVWCPELCLCHALTELCLCDALTELCLCHALSCVCVMPWLSCVCVMPWLSCVCVMPWVVSVSGHGGGRSKETCHHHLDTTPRTWRKLNVPRAELWQLHWWCHCGVSTAHPTVCWHRCVMVAISQLGLSPTGQGRHSGGTPQYSVWLSACWVCFFLSFFLLFLKYFFVLRGTSGSPYLDKAQQLQDRHCPFLPVCAVFSCVQTAAWLPVFGIFNAHTDDDGYNCTQGLYRYCKRVRWKLTGRKIPCCTGDLNLCQYYTWLFSQALYHLELSWTLA